MQFATTSVSTSVSYEWRMWRGPFGLWMSWSFRKDGRRRSLGKRTFALVNLNLKGFFCVVSVANDVSTALLWWRTSSPVWVRVLHCLLYRSGFISVTQTYTTLSVFRVWLIKKKVSNAQQSFIYLINNIVQIQIILWNIK